MLPSDTKDSTSEYAMLASTKFLTPIQARVLFNDSTKRAAIVRGPEEGYTSKQKINHSSNNQSVVITTLCVLMPSQIWKFYQSSVHKYLLLMNI